MEMTAPPVKAGWKAMTRVMQMKTKGWLRKVRRCSTVPLEALLLLLQLLPVLLLVACGGAAAAAMMSPDMFAVTCLVESHFEVLWLACNTQAHVTQAPHSWLHKEEQDSAQQADDTT